MYVVDVNADVNSSRFNEDPHLRSMRREDQIYDIEKDVRSVQRTLGGPGMQESTTSMQPGIPRPMTLGGIRMILLRWS